ncbi:metallophosphoesterase family protein [Patescibacteria group bacterium]
MKKFFGLILIAIVGASIYLAWDLTQNPDIAIDEVGSTVTSGIQSQTEIIDTEEPQGDELFSFLVFGDNQGNEPLLARIVESASSDDIDFVVNLGDSAEDGKEESFKAFFEGTKGLPKPMYSVTGNHDIGVDGTLNLFYQYIYANHYYSWTYENRHFITLYNVGQSALLDEQLDWLEHELDQNSDKAVILFMHKPIDVPFGEFVGYDTNIPEKRVTRFRSILNSRENIEHIYAGHAHAYLHYFIENIPVTVSGGGGAPMIDTSFLSEDPGHHFLVIRAYETGLVEEVVPIGQTSQ